MYAILSGLPELRITRLLSDKPLVLETSWTGKRQCPRCSCTSLRTKDSFWRYIRNGRIYDRFSILKVRCHKFLCLGCRRYFNTRIAGVRLWSRSTEALKRSVFAACNRGCTASAVARDYGIGTASVERFYHHVLGLENRKMFPLCPRVLGIDEHRFTRKLGFATTFCDLRHRRVFDIALGRDTGSLSGFFRSLRGRDRVRIVCMDMNRAYRNLVRRWFPNAMIVLDRFHVIRLVNERFRQVLTELDDKRLPYNRGRLMRMMTMARQRLAPAQKTRLERYFLVQPAIGVLYGFWHELNDLLRSRNQTMAECKRLIPRFLGYLQQLVLSPFAPLKTLGKTLGSWKEEIVRMFRFSRSNGITEGGHRKMKLIQRRAYGFRNFENYRLRGRALSG